MTKKIFRNSRLNAPSNLLCMNAFSRELKNELIGKISDGQEYEKVKIKLQLLPINVSATTWHNWWNGISMPEGDNLKFLRGKFPEIVDKWFASPPNNRIQRHFFTLDLVKTVKVKEFHRAAFPSKMTAKATIDEVATLILGEIHNEWHPNYFGEINLTSPKERTGVDCYSKRALLKETTFLKDQRDKISIGITLGPESELSLPASHKTRRNFEPINPFSVLKFMLAYAIQTNLPDPGLKQAFIFDFLTAIIAALVMMSSASPGNIVENADISMIFLLSQNFFWGEEDFNDPFWLLNHPFVGHFLPYLETFIEEENLNQSWELFAELKSIYYQSLEITGKSQKELIDFFSEHI
jgi:hypothetical protein